MVFKLYIDTIFITEFQDLIDIASITYHYPRMYISEGYTSQK